MNQKNRELVLGIIACFLLVLYSVAISQIIISVIREPVPGNQVNENITWIINLIGGIVTGVVIGNLALSPPGETPVSPVRNMSEAYGKNLMKTIVWIYIIVWLFTGLSAFYIGVMKYPGVSGTLTETGKAWLGILVGAAYAWFGIKKT